MAEPARIELDVNALREELREELSVSRADALLAKLVRLSKLARPATRTPKAEITDMARRHLQKRGIL